MQALETLIQQLKQADLYRKRDLCASHHTNVLQFSSNDYLGLTKDPRVMQAYQDGFARYPTGSGGSMVVCGYHPIHHELEKTFAHVLGVDDCLLFSSGMAANMGVMQLLAHCNTQILIDKYIHASIYDGLKNTKIVFKRYRHNDLDDLATKLTATETTILTESIFSMSGSLTPLQDLQAKLDPTLHKIIVDEAHAFGVLGNNGLGGVVAAGLTQDDVPLRIIPFGKACAASGAIVAGKAIWIEALLQVSRTYIYSTGFSPALAYGLLKTLDFVQNAHEQRDKLTQLVQYFRQHIQNSKLKWRDSTTPIQQLQLGCPNIALQYKKILYDQQIICVPMRQPTVNKHDTGLRIILNATHELKHIDQLFKALHAIR
jgi:8-amino-7-oxononanoate synthase